MGSAAVQGQLWGARAEDWASYAEQVGLPLFGAVLDSARVTSGTRLLDAGCGAGLLALAPHLGTLSEPGALAAVVKAAGLRVVDEGEVACPFVFPGTEASWRGNASAGVNQAAIAHSGEAAVRAVYAHADREHTRPDGTVRYENVFLWVAGERP